MIELTTQCPQCQHRFDVSLEQLQQRKGVLRCPRCAQIFDAYECAVTKPHAPMATLRDPSPPATGPIIKTRAQAAKSAPISAPAPVSVTTPTVAAIRSTQPIQSPPPDEPVEDIRVYLTREPELPADTVLDELKGLRAEPRRLSQQSSSSAHTSDSGRLLWRAVVFVLLVITVLQLLYVYRAQIANTVRFTRPVLELMCEGVGCTIPYMREINAIEIRQTALQQQPNFEQNGRYAYLLQLQMKNTLPWAQEWPTLVVSFSDASAAVLATVAISPDEYLPPSQRSRPFEPGAQIQLRLPVQLPDKQINGFIVEKYYP